MSNRDRFGEYFWRNVYGSDLVITTDTDVSKHANTNQESELESADTYYYLEERADDGSRSRECVSVNDPEECLEAFYHEVQKDLDMRFNE